MTRRMLYRLGRWLVDRYRPSPRMSVDYFPGVSGWALNGDGTFEMNDATFTGQIERGEA